MSLSERLRAALAAPPPPDLLPGDLVEGAVLAEERAAAVLVAVTRRPDPGYRPGGTSSYRPNRAILADDDAAGGPIQPVAFELPAAPN